MVVDLLGFLSHKRHKRTIKNPPSQPCIPSFQGPRELAALSKAAEAAKMHRQLQQQDQEGRETKNIKYIESINDQQRGGMFSYSKAGNSKTAYPNCTYSESQAPSQRIFQAMPREPNPSAKCLVSMANASHTQDCFAAFTEEKLRPRPKWQDMPSLDSLMDMSVTTSVFTADSYKHGESSTTVDSASRYAERYTATPRTSSLTHALRTDVIERDTYRVSAPGDILAQERKSEDCVDEVRYARVFDDRTVYADHFRAIHPNAGPDIGMEELGLEIQENERCRLLGLEKPRSIKCTTSYWRRIRKWKGNSKRKEGKGKYA